MLSDVAFFYDHERLEQQRKAVFGEWHPKSTRGSPAQILPRVSLRFHSAPPPTVQSRLAKVRELLYGEITFVGKCKRLFTQGRIPRCDGSRLPAAGVSL